jgi:lethal(3)malignant brain tumor-like protein
MLVGYRIRLHFDGYSDSHDFWVNADSENLFPCGWCEKNGQKLQSPKNHDPTRPFNWAVYLKQSGVGAAPRTLFYSTQNEVKFSICWCNREK